MNQRNDDGFDKGLPRSREITGVTGIPVATWKMAFEENPVILSIILSVVTFAVAGMGCLAFVR